MKKLLLTSALAAAALTVIAARHRATITPAPKPVVIDPFRSLVITEPAMLEGFDFQRVLQTLIDRSGATATTPLSLYRQRT